MPFPAFLSRRVLRDPRTCRACAQQGVASKPRRQRAGQDSILHQDFQSTMFNLDHVRHDREGLGGRAIARDAGCKQEGRTYVC